MAFTSAPWGNATSFSGIPMQVNNPAYTGNQFGLSGMLASDISGAPLGNGQPPNVPNPQALGLMSNVQSQAGALDSAGGSAVSAALGTQQQIGGLANQLQSIGTGMQTQFAGNIPYANQALQTAFDPNSSAYNYYLNQAQNAAGSAAAQQGQAGTPYGAEIQGATTGAFGNAWQTAQVGREATGAATATGLQQQQLASQTAGGQLINEAGQLDLGSLSSVLQGYGLQGSNLAAAGTLLSQLLGDLSVSVSNSNGQMLTGVQGSSTYPQGNTTINPMGA